MKVIKNTEEYIEFDNGLTVIGDGEYDCCAVNYLDFDQLPVGTELPTMDAEEFQKNIKVKEDGFIVKDSQGTPKWVQARSEQNGYYSNITTLVLEYKGKKIEVARLSGEESE